MAEILDIQHHSQVIRNNFKNSNTMNSFKSARALSGWRFNSYCELNYCEQPGFIFENARPYCEPNLLLT